MKITTNEGEFELIEFSGDVPEESTSQETTLKPTRLYALKPVKKTQKKEKKFYLSFHTFSVPGYEIDEELDLTPTTANKLSEAISALVNFMQTSDSDKAVSKWTPLEIKIEEARESFQESQ